MSPLNSPRHLQQHGIALAAVMLLLLVITLIGTLSLRMAKEQETMSNSLQDLTRAQFAAEEAIRAAIDLPIWSIDYDPDDPNWFYESPTVDNGDASYKYKIRHRRALGNAAALKDSEGFNYYVVRAQGNSDNARRQIEVAVISLFSATTLDTSAFIGCRGVDFSSNAVVDSYNSTTDPGGNTDLGGGHVKSLESGSPYNGDVRFDSNSTVRGTVRAYGSIQMNDNTSIEGAYANGEIDDNGGAGKINGNAFSGDRIRTSVNGQKNENLSPNPVKLEECDPLSVTDLVNDSGSEISGHNSNSSFGVGSNINGNKTLGANGASHDFAVHNVTLDGDGMTILGDVRLYISGNLEIYNDGWLHVASGATLKIYIKGKWTMDSNSMANMGTDKDNPVAGIPANLLVFASIDSNSFLIDDSDSAKVEFNSNVRFSGVMYAPKTHVMYNSNADSYGAVRGRWVQMNSNGFFHYDEALKDLSLGSGTTDLGYKIVYWTEDSYESYDDF